MKSSEFAASHPIQWICPNCSKDLSRWASDVQSCMGCGALFRRRNSIYYFLLPSRLAELQPFLSQYRHIREQDGYRLRPSGYYRALPATDDRDPQAAVWRVRRASFHHLQRWMQSQFANRSITILDLGAGNGWLSHCLTARGHGCVAVDLNDDAEDGLGAQVHYPASFLCVQADYDCLPFAPGQFDLVVFNASLHYSTNILATLQHACRLLLPGGALAIMDSPVFKTEAAGRQMRAEMVTSFKTRCQGSTVLHQGMGFLTLAGLTEIAKALDIDSQFFYSSGGLLWDIQRFVAGLKLRREPANFGIWIGRRSQSAQAGGLRQ